MIVRRRTQKRPLTEFAQGPWVHGTAIGALRAAVLAALALIGYLTLVPMMVDGLVNDVHNGGQ